MHSAAHRASCTGRICGGVSMHGGREWSSLWKLDAKNSIVGAGYYPVDRTCWIEEAG